MKPDRDPLDDQAISAVRAHFDEEMAEARVRYRAPRLSGRARRSGAGGPNRFAPRAIGALAVVALAIVVGTTFWIVARNAPGPAAPTASPTDVGVVRSASPSLASPSLASPSLASPSLASPSLASPSASASQSAAPNIGTPNYLQGTVGMNGSAAWVLSDTGLSLSQDGGRTWSAVALPSGVKSSAVLAVNAVTGRAVWLASQDGAGVRLFRRLDGTTTWSSALLTPSWGTSEMSGQPVQQVILTPGPAGLVTVTETIGLGMSTALEALFVSANDGQTFTPHGAPIDSGIWASVTFSTPQSGILVGGPGTAPHVIKFTSDGGNTWSNPTVTGLPADGYYQLGPSLLVGSDIEVPVTAFTSSGGTDTNFFLLTSHDGGATFAPAGTATPSAGNFYPAFDSLGQVTWAEIVGGALQETADGGRTWTTVTAAGLPAGVRSIQLTSATSATAVVVENGCTGVKTGCYTRTYLVATTDGGATWTNI